MEANSFCLDVGCDHALLDIYLVKKNKNIKAIASDIAEGPLEQAKQNIIRENLENEIETRLGPGLKTYSEGIDTIIISGMGGRNIIGICKDSPKVLKKINTLIISPNNYQEDVKRYLCKNGFYIENEEFVRDKKFIYQIIIFKKGKKKYTNKEYFFGPVFLIKKGPLFREYYERELKTREILISILPNKYFLRKKQISKEIDMIKKEIED
ncbi:MAG: SAM-dependent methyltransferase [Bacilli bacterium]|nr:SAM-dependent methyltransferase [Bacilli bacterium]MBR6137728.1 SAM-dependent methyltransferase [Bacilli bacterium]